ncbi:hypothetical protein [Niveispirillum sp. KHB5.9]|uniref:hypothetical protein n=1 Tax=Niveispirillum sp. KHB5.9 TaxID=3400269 RepID=UPI003A850CB3
MTYRADGHQLFDPDGRLLLGGPETEIAAFAAWLSANPPAGEVALRQALADLIEGTRDCGFAPYVPLSQEAADDLDEARRDLAGRLAKRARDTAQMDMFGGHHG